MFNYKKRNINCRRLY